MRSLSSPNSDITPSLFKLFESASLRHKDREEKFPQVPFDVQEPRFPPKSPPPFQTDFVRTAAADDFIGTISIEIPKRDSCRLSCNSPPPCPGDFYEANPTDFAGHQPTHEAYQPATLQ